jgi:hypothetical protein
MRSPAHAYDVYLSERFLEYQSFRVEPRARRQRRRESAHMELRADWSDTFGNWNVVGAAEKTWREEGDACESAGI